MWRGHDFTDPSAANMALPRPGIDVTFPILGLSWRATRNLDRRSTGRWLLVEDGMYLCRSLWLSPFVDSTSVAADGS